MAQDLLKRLGAGMAHTLKKMFAIALYLGTLLSLFAIHRSLLLHESGLAARIGFSFLNAWALAKVVLIGQELRVGDSFRNKPLVYVIVFKSAIFALLLFVFRIIEEALIGMYHGKSFTEALMEGHPSLEQAKFSGIVLICVILFFALLPFFAYLEITGAIGREKMRALLFQVPEDEAALPEAAAAEDAGRSVAAAPPAKAPRDRLWYFENDGATLGPIPGHAVLELIRTGDLDGDSLVHEAAAGGQWRTVAESGLTPAGNDRRVLPRR
jgi:hypothetical protein